MRQLDAMAEALASELYGHSPWYEKHKNNKAHEAWKDIRVDAQYVIRALSELGYEVCKKREHKARPAKAPKPKDGARP